MHRLSRVLRNIAPMGLILLSFFSCAAQADVPLTLEQALAEAAAHNARLPVAEMDVAASQQQEVAARGALLPRLSVESTLQVAPPDLSYGTGGAASFAGEERLQIVGRETLYDGGALRAGVTGAESQVRSSRAAFRVAQKDLELDVRTRFSELLKAQEDLGSREQGLDRLRSYLATVRERQAAGEGLQADVIKTQARLASEQADAEEARRKLRQAQLQLNDLLGRDPGAPLVAASLPAPQPPPPQAESWQQVPDLAQVQADQAAAEANVGVARSGRRPHVDLLADAGLLGGGFANDVPSSSFGGRLRNDVGASLTVSISLPFLDFGIYQGQLGQAQARAEQARRRVVMQSREARLRWTAAQEDLVRWYRQVQFRQQALPLARDAYVVAESLYRGGSGTALEVLDAFSNLIAASQSYTDAVLSYRVAEATALRWGTP